MLCRASSEASYRYTSKSKTEIAVVKNEGADAVVVVEAPAPGCTFDGDATTEACWAVVQMTLARMTHLYGVKCHPAPAEACASCCAVLLEGCVMGVFHTR
jgi:hypothetical protein